jgi:hypothetical protein
MSNTQHTPGPWAVRDHWSDEGAFEVYPTRNGKQPKFGEWAALAEVPEYGEGEAEANALLIAAAPDLLEALKLIASAENSALDLAYCKGIARAAIAKATGVQS